MNRRNVIIPEKQNRRTARAHADSKAPKCAFHACNRKAVLKHPAACAKDLERYRFCSISCAEQHQQYVNIRVHLRKISAPHEVGDVYASMICGIEPDFVPPMIHDHDPA